MSRPSYVKLTPSSPPPTRPAFTLVELLVVIAIIGILTSLALVVGGRVAKGGERSLTESTLRVLDTTLTEYMSERSSKFPTYYEDGLGNVFPIVDGRDANRANTSGDRILDFAEPSVAFYLLIARDVPAVQETLKGLDPRIQRSVQFKDTRDTPGANANNSDAAFGQNPSRIKTSAGLVPMDAANKPASGLFVNDAWGNPIRFVIPAFHGGHGDFWNGTAMVTGQRPNRTFTGNNRSYRRSYRPFPASQLDKAVGDADEGMCAGGRPYFYSAGPDGDPGTRDDNVYTVTPQFPLETRDLK